MLDYNLRLEEQIRILKKSNKKLGEDKQLLLDQNKGLEKKLDSVQKE